MLSRQRATNPGKGLRSKHGEGGAHTSAGGALGHRVRDPPKMMQNHDAHQWTLLMEGFLTIRKIMGGSLQQIYSQDIGR